MKLLKQLKRYGMVTAVNIIILTALMISISIPSYAQKRGVFLRDDFNNLESWKPLNFQKIKQHTEYSTVQEGENSYLKADSNASASGKLADTSGPNASGRTRRRAASTKART